MSCAAVQPRTLTLTVQHTPLSTAALNASVNASHLQHEYVHSHYTATYCDERKSCDERMTMLGGV